MRVCGSVTVGQQKNGRNTPFLFKEPLLIVACKLGLFHFYIFKFNLLLFVFETEPRSVARAGVQGVQSVLYFK